ncbi:hypothetical protein E2562_017631 [Oryza meyeriana var. granulata]|uniref:Uncharacterized protein n=1 Tax=Oryza meyeriana var. granulata TaxID=110450 RepID=A0A6G1BY16_9ORYZ|nr:hypothetical protein E2562_017631 [Oryza meyeriana var. granulata]
MSRQLYTIDAEQRGAIRVCPAREAIAALCSQFTNLQKVEINYSGCTLGNGNQIDNQEPEGPEIGLRFLLGKCKALEKLCLEYVSSVVDNDMIALSQTCKNLKSISLWLKPEHYNVADGCEHWVPPEIGFTQEGLLSLVQSCPIRVLVLNGALFFNDMGMKALSSAPFLDTLILMDCEDVTDHGMRFIMQVRKMLTTEHPAINKCKQTGEDTGCLIENQNACETGALMPDILSEAGFANMSISGDSSSSELSKQVASVLRPCIVSLASFIEGTMLFGCRGIFIPPGSDADPTSVLTSASLIRSSDDESKIIDNLTIKVRLPDDLVVIGWLHHYDLKHSAAETINKGDPYKLRGGELTCAGHPMAEGHLLCSQIPAATRFVSVQSRHVPALGLS